MIFKKKKTQTPVKRYIEIQKADLANIMIETGATINQTTIDKVSEYIEEQNGHFVTNMKKTISNWYNDK